MHASCGAQGLEPCMWCISTYEPLPLPPHTTTPQHHHTTTHNHTQPHTHQHTHTNHTNTNTNTNNTNTKTNQPTTNNVVFFCRSPLLNISGQPMTQRDTGAAKRRRERPFRSWLQHERLTVAVALAESLHHSAYRATSSVMDVVVESAALEGTDDSQCRGWRDGGLRDGSRCWR